MKKKLVKLFLICDCLEKHRKALIMANLFFFLAFFNVQLQAEILGQKMVSMNLQDASLFEMLGSIEEQTGVGFLYSESEINTDEKINVNVNNESLGDLLSNVLPDLGVDFEVDESVIILTAHQEQKEEVVVELEADELVEINGKITDKDGFPLPGATVMEKGSVNGVTTDVDGNFSIDVADENAVLKVSYIGFTTQLITIGNQTVFNIVLTESATSLSEVVVTGYQTISKERATGSFSIVTEEDLSAKLNNDLTQMIEGMTTGLVTDHEGNITIRGLSTFGLQYPDYYYTDEQIAIDKEMKSPLIVLDGFPYEGDLSSINGDNIANITVLKDGVAASIYGSRSTNGVIVVTSKKGKKGELKVSYKGTFSMTKKTDYKDFHFSSTSDYIDANIKQFESAPYYYYHNPYARETPVNYILADVGAGVKTMEQALVEIEKYRSIDAYSQLQEYALRNQFSQQHNISINGGGEKNLFNASINYLDRQGEEILSNDDRLIVDIKNTWKPVDFITFSTTANIVYEKSESSATSTTFLLTDYFGAMTPYDAIVDENGNPKNIEGWVNPAKVDIYDSYFGMKDAGYSPLEDMKLGMNSMNDLQTRLSANLKVDIIEGLNVTVGGAWTRGNTNTKTEYKANSFKARIGYNDATSISDPSKHYLPEGGIIDEKRGFNENYTIRTQINYNKSFADTKHRVSIIAGNEVRKDTYDQSTLATRVGYNPTSGDFIFIDNSVFHPYYSPVGYDYLGGYWSSLPRLGTGAYTLRDNRYVSWYGNGSYEFDNRFIISGSIRTDLANLFGTDPKYRNRPIWSLGGTYKLSKEKWFNVSWIDRMNVRASYGINGNIAFPEGPFMILKSQGFSQVAQGVAYAVQSPPNNQLRWEKTATSNFGVDLTILDNRVNFSIDYYLKKSSDVLAPDAVDRTTGVATLTKNAGKITNKGIEIAISAYVIKTADFTYNTNLNFSYNKNMVDEYNVNRAYSSYYLMDDGAGMAEPGYPLASSWGFAAAPLSAEGSSQTYNAAGELIHPDNVEKDDLVYMGTVIPSLNIAWTNSFTYKDFDVSFMLVGSFGAIMWMDAFTGSNISNRHVAEAWENPGDELTTIYPKVSLWGDGWWSERGAQYVVSADYVKLRDLTIAYNLPQKWMKQIGMKRAKLYLQGRNLLRITAKGVDIDPETRYLPVKSEIYAGISVEF